MPESFKCPSCSAPLEFEGKMTQKCRFCGGSVIVPAQMFYQKPDENFTDFSTFDFASLTGKALKIAEIQREIQAGRKINAIKIYRETFGVGLKEAKDAVEALERGESINISGTRVQTASVNQKIHTLDAEGLRNAKKIGLTVGGSILGTIVLVTLLILGFTAALLFFTFRSVERTIDKTTDFKSSPVDESAPKARAATEILRFGGEGLGAGKFKDNRTIAVDADGNIYSADYMAGRIQKFDADGNFQMQITGDANRTVDALGTDRKGNLFALQGYDLYRFNAETGERNGKFRIDSANDFAVGLDGRIYVSTSRGGIQIYDAGGAKLQTVQLAKELNIERVEKIEVDAGGNLYLIEGRENSVFKLAPDGKFLLRFAGRKSNATGKNQSITARDFALDSTARIFVTDYSDVFVFDANGVLINSFDAPQTFDLTFNKKDELFTAARPFVVKYKLNF